MPIVRNFNLFLHAGHSTSLVIHANQYDSGEQWVFTLYNADGTQYTPSTGAIVGIKSDGLGIINSGSVVDGKVVINETQQMTAAVGKAVFELMIDSQTHGTANFVVLVEEKPGNNADMSESDLSLLQEAIDATSPLPTGGTVGQVLTKTANGSAWSNAGTPTQEQVADAVSDWADEHITVTTGVVIDTSLAVAGAAADSKKVGDEITDLKSAIQSGGGFNSEVKQALENLLANVAYKGNDPTGRTYLTALHNAMYPPANLSSISAVYTQSGTVYNTDSLDSLKADLVVTAHYSDSTAATVTNYVLSGTLTVGTSTIIVTYGGKTTTFSVTVTRAPYVYELPSEFVSDSTNYIDTGVELESGNVYSVLLDYTITSLVNSVLYVFGNKIADSNVYSALQVTSKQGNHMWGVGIGYATGSNLVTAGRRYKAVAIANVDSASWSITLKDVTAGTTNTYTNTYTVPAFTTGKAIFIGNGEGGSSNTGFIGTMHDFKITDRALTSEEITAYLNG